MSFSIGQKLEVIFGTTGKRSCEIVNVNSDDEMNIEVREDGDEPDTTSIIWLKKNEQGEYQTQPPPGRR